MICRDMLIEMFLVVTQEGRRRRRGTWARGRPAPEQTNQDIGKQLSHFSNA